MSPAKKAKKPRFPKEYMTLNEAAEMTGIPRGTLYQWLVTEERIETKRIPGFTGKRSTVIFMISDFQRFLDDHTVPARERGQRRASA